MKAVEAKARLKDAKERLARVQRKAHPDIGDLAGAKATVSFWTHYLAWEKEQP